MHIYFHSKNLSPIQTSAVRFLESQGHSVLGQVSGKKSSPETFEKKAYYCSKSDITLIDISTPSIEAGFVLAVSLQLGNPVLILHTKETPKIHPEIKTILLENSLCSIQSYTDEKSFLGHTQAFFEGFSKELKARFNLVMRHDQDKYLEWAAVTHNTSKTSLIVKGIDLLRESDTEYKKASDSK